MTITTCIDGLQETIIGAIQAVVPPLALGEENLLGHAAQAPDVSYAAVALASDVATGLAAALATFKTALEGRYKAGLTMGLPMTGAAFTTLIKAVLIPAAGKGVVAVEADHGHSAEHYSYTVSAAGASGAAAIDASTGYLDTLADWMSALDAVFASGTTTGQPVGTTGEGLRAALCAVASGGAAAGVAQAVEERMGHYGPAPSIVGARGRAVAEAGTNFDAGFADFLAVLDARYKWYGAEE
jgi:hypothetical protein